MNIDESKIIEDCDETKALACLLASGACFLNVVDVGAAWGLKEKKSTTCVYVMANDVFAWACADGETITFNDGDEPSEIIELYKLWKEDSKWGEVKWLCHKRNEQPQFPIKRDMIRDKSWSETLEALPENKYDKYCRERKSTPTP